MLLKSDWEIPPFFRRLWSVCEVMLTILVCASLETAVMGVEAKLGQMEGTSASSIKCRN